MADSSSRQTTRASSSLSRTRRSHTEPLVARRSRSSLRARPYPNPTVTRPASITNSQRATAHQWNWLPLAVATWRIEENIEILTDGREYTAMDLSPYTQEPTHLTVPVLTARVHRHERQLRDMNLELQETREHWRLTAMERINEVAEDHENTVNNMDVLHNKVVEIAVEAALLRHRLDECEQRSREAEEYARGLVQRLVLAEDNARQASRLANTVDRLVTMMEQINLHRD